MKVYFASPENTDFSALKLYGVKRFLFSYHLLQKVEDKRLKEYLKAEDLFLDSGAFTAKTLGVEIDIEKYISFIQKNEIENYAGLDVIGDGETTLKNTNYMIEKGLKPIHTFHRGTVEKYLYKAIELDLDYIALGGMVGNKRNIFEWLDNVWYIIMKERPELKVHGFGCTSYELMTRYPWYSVDSTTWNAARKFGNGINSNGVSLDKNQILNSLRSFEPLQFFSDGNLLLLQNVFSMLLLEQKVNTEDLKKNYNYLTSQEKLF